MLTISIFLCGCVKIQEVEDVPEEIVTVNSAVFTDVQESDWFYDAVVYCCENGMMNGITADSFLPKAPMTRAMLVTVLWRVIGSPEAEDAGFADVPQDAWYYTAVNWASNNSIVNGVGDNVFAPDSPISREQAAAILYRWSLLGESGVHLPADLGDPDALFAEFADSDAISPWALQSVQWALANGIITGVPGKNDTDLPYILPEDGTSRAQFCTILMRLLQ